MALWDRGLHYADAIAHPSERLNDLNWAWFKSGLHTGGRIDAG